MKKKSSIIKLALIGVALILGIILSVCSFDTPFGFRKYKSFASAIKLGLDLKGGVYAVYETESEGVASYEEALEGTQARLQDMLVSEGYSEAIVTIENNTRLRVEVPDVDNPSAIFELIGKPAELVFTIDGTEVFSGDYITNATAGYSTEQAAPVVYLEMTDEGGDKFAKVTTDNVGKTMNIYRVIDGVQETNPISSATIQEAIVGGTATITMSGQDTQAAEDLASQILSGTFDLKLSLKESSTIPASLGEKALTLSIIAAAIGLAIVVLVLILRYRMFGVVATLSLSIYTVLMLFFLAVLPWVQLSLPGIAGIILSLGMAVDGNVIIYERIYDEYRGGKSLLASVHAGFKKATVAIFDSNVTTIIAAIILLIFGKGSISGFGLTLLIGIILSMFTSLVVNRGLCKYVTAINNTSEKLYGVKRGKDYVASTVDTNSDAEVIEVAPEVTEGGNA